MSLKMSCERYCGGSGWLASVLPLVLAALLLAGTASAQETTVHGRVVDAANNIPLARVRLVASIEGTPLPAILTDSDGRFVLTTPRAAFTLAASKAGYATASIPSGNIDEPLDIRLPRGGAITGFVLDPYGLPLQEVTLAARPVEAAEAAPGLTAETDDLGQYRFGGLEPGRYEVSASARVRAVVDVSAGDDSVAPNLVVSLPAERLRPRRPVMTRRGHGSIVGRVTTVNGPLPGATVRLYRESGGVALTADTDVQGNYALDDVAPGAYVVEVSRSGWLTQRYGQLRAAQAGAIVTIRADGVTRGIDVVLGRGTAIAGAVLDDNGEPLSGIAVLPLLVSYGRGRSIALPMRRWVITDDRGRFRLYGLSPGSYIISAQTDAVLEGTDGYAPVYYPRATRIAEADTVMVDGAGDVHDVQIVFTRTRVARVSGIALGADGRPLASAHVQLMPSARSSAIATMPAAAVTSADGTFSIPNVPQGEYVAQARVEWTRERPAEFGTELVAVTDAPPPALVIRTSRGATAAGRLLVNGERAGTVDARIAPTPIDYDFGPTRNTIYSYSWGSDGSFQIDGLIGPTRFELDAPGKPAWFIRSITLDGVDITDVPFDFGTGGRFANLVVDVGTAGAALTGSVTDERGMRVSGYSIVVFSRSALDWYPLSRRVRFTRAAQDGSFEIAGLPPGSYWVVATDIIDGSQFAGEWQDPEVLRRFSAVATPVTLTEAATQQRTLRLIRR